MYQALYRKYRPTNFDDVTGQEIIKRTLENAIINNKISHAYLFTGPRGTGKTSIAKILAKTVNCTNLVGYKPCNKCVNCTQTDNKQSNDIIEIDAASNNGVDEIREIRNKVNLVPSTGKYKIYIIDEVHMLTTGAFNALLKTLEEPPAHIIFILATTEPHKVPSTILSRCQRFDFKRIPLDAIVLRLKYIISQEKISIDEDAIIEIARLSDGGMRDSIGLLDQAYAYSPENITINDIHEINGSLPQEQLTLFIDYLIKSDITNLLKMIDEFNSSGKSLIKISEEVINYLKNILLYKISPDYIKDITNNYNIYQKHSEKISRQKVISLIDKFNMSLNNIKNSNDPKLAMELLIIKECFIEEEHDEKNIVNEIKINEIKVKPEDTKIIIEHKNEEIKSENCSEILKEDKGLLEFKLTRIDNTLAKFDKKTLNTIRKQLSCVEDYLLDMDYSNVASIIIDGELKAASDEYLVFVFKTDNMANEFNKNLIKIQDLFYNIIGKSYKVIATENISWEITKEEFNNKNRKFEYKLEADGLEEKIFKNDLSEEIEELDNIFGDIVEYK